jgi:hypothetical protein
VRVKQLIRNLEEALIWTGQEDADVWIKEHNGQFIERLGVMSDISANLGGNSFDEKIVVIEAYVRLR